MSEKSNFEQLLDAGKFTVTAEIGPPMSANAEFVRKRAQELKGSVDAAYVTDNQTAIVRMSSIAAALLVAEEGVEPIVQMTCRDRNRIAIQSDLLGAYALGLKNLLVLSGDHQSFGNHPQSKNVYDVDSSQLICALNNLQENGVFMGGSACKAAPRFFIGGAGHPFADPQELQIMRLKKKVDGGARFITTQAIYDIDKFKQWMELVRSQGLHKRTHIQAGICVNKTLKSLQMTKLVAGMDVPDYLIDRMDKAEDKQAEGVNIAVDLLSQIKEVEGVSGIHIMAIGWESIVPVIVERLGLLPRPTILEV
ncbi:MAG: methylenetetrahydrofolate reductase [Defluviitaleaceae bacterium]|nr:methylenetetrahydrofolate reductase [Defluviitaleaceae bacterium]